MKYVLVEKHTSDLSDEEIDELSVLANTCFYLRTVSHETVREIFFSDGRIYNFIFEHEDEPVAFFQAKDLPKIDSVYFFSASVHPDYRGEGIHPWVTDYRLEHYKKQGRKYAGARSMNPLMIKNLVGKGFFLPTKENPELLQKAKDILVAIEGSNLGIKDDFVIPRKNTIQYPNALDVEESDNSEINDFISGHMDIKKGDRLFLIREI